VAAVPEFDRHLQTLAGRHRRVPAGIGRVGILQAGENPNRFLHAGIISIGADTRCPSFAAAVSHVRTLPRLCPPKPSAETQKKSNQELFSRPALRFCGSALGVEDRKGQS